MYMDFYFTLLILWTTIYTIENLFFFSLSVSFIIGCLIKFSIVL